MGENIEPRMEFAGTPRPRKKAMDRGVGVSGNPITDRLRIIGQRRREAEEKLDRHLQDARARR